jgi:eukaryotic-like serine/threonine-protein kinase
VGDGLGVRRGWAFVAVAVLLAGGSAVLLRLWPLGALASGVGAGFSVLAGVWSARGAAAMQDRDDRRDPGGDNWHLVDGRLPLVEELDDPVAMGVHPAVTLGSSLEDRVSPFVSRQFDAELGRALRRDRFLLLVGESTAGKSRAAYELMRSELRRYRVVQPTRRDGVMAAAARAAATPRTVLWLDDLERFLGSGGLTGAAAREVLGARGDARLIVATMRSEEYAKFSGRSAPGLEGIGRDALRQGWDVLRQAARFDIPRMWSAEDIGRARQFSQDRRMVEAVEHSDQYGIAEYLAAAPQLLAEWRDAWAPGTHPRAAAMVLAAVDARRAGIHRPLSREILYDLHGPYLVRRGGDRLRPESEDAARTWATTPLYATSSLLVPGDGGLLAFDYLIDAIDKQRMPAESIKALTAIATPGEALDIGQLAWGWSLIDEADNAFRRAEEGGLFQATARRCALLAEERAGHSAALRFAENAAEWTLAAYGPHHRQTLEAQLLVAAYKASSDRTTALQMIGDIVAHCERVLGSADETTLSARAGAADIIGDDGSFATAVKLYREVAADAARHLGEDHQTTLMCRDQAAMWVSESGRPEQAARMYAALLTDMTERFHSRGDDVLHTRAQMACCLARAGDYERALDDWDQIVADASAMYGRLHSTTLYVRDQHAWCLGESGDPGGAVALLERRLADVVELDDPQLIHLLFARRSLAWWIGESGDPAKAAQQFRALVDDATAQRGPDDRRVRSLRLMLVHWNVLNDAAGDAADILRDNIGQLADELGPGHEITRAAARHVAAC